MVSYELLEQFNKLVDAHNSCSASHSNITETLVTATTFQEAIKCCMDRCNTITRESESRLIDLLSTTPSREEFSAANAATQSRLVTAETKIERLELDNQNNDKSIKDLSSELVTSSKCVNSLVEENAELRASLNRLIDSFNTLVHNYTELTTMYTDLASRIKLLEDDRR